MGDFNAITGDNEQIGQKVVHNLSCEEFNRFISEAGLIDLDTTRPFLTWRICHIELIHASCLDRSLVSYTFFSSWVELSALVLP